MRVLAILLVLIFAVVGVIFGALNADMVSYDLVFAHVQLPKGAALFAALVLGWVLGGVLVWLLSAHPVRRRLKKTERALATTNEGIAPP